MKGRKDFLSRELEAPAHQQLLREKKLCDQQGCERNVPGNAPMSCVGCGVDSGVWVCFLNSSQVTRRWQWKTPDSECRDPERAGGPLKRDQCRSLCFFVRAAPCMRDRRVQSADLTTAPGNKRAQQPRAAAVQASPWRLHRNAPQQMDEGKEGGVGGGGSWGLYSRGRAWTYGCEPRRIGAAKMSGRALIRLRKWEV